MSSADLHTLSECKTSPCEYCRNLVMVYQINPFKVLEPEVYCMDIFHTPCSECSNIPVVESILCASCQHVRLHHILCCLPNKPIGLCPEVTLGLYADIQMRHHCTFCAFVSETLKKYEQLSGFKIPSNEPIDLRIWRGLENKKFATSVEPNARIEVGGSSNWKFPNLEICVRKRHSPLTSTRVGKTVDWNRLRNWIELCTSNHFEESSHESYELQNFFLLDVKRNCISAQPALSRYIALSYVWGNPITGRIEATKANIDYLQREGSLLQYHIPATIRDAMTACRNLEIRFLWVDRLCIVQDDQVHKHEQIQSMGQIYSQALLTICAASGVDAESGLPGVEPTVKRWPRDRISLLGMEILTGTREKDWHMAWKLRGWTYQEEILSRRRLIFTNQDVFLECSYETMADATTPVEKSNDIGSQGETTFEEYTHHVSNYARRILSYQSDVHNAFMGVFNTLYSQEDFIYGLPAKDFDQAILWVHHREPGRTRCSGLSRNLRLPTWSWTSKFGHIILFSLQGGSMLGSLVKWAYLDQHYQIRFIETVNDPCHRTLAWKTLYDSRLYLALAWQEGLVERPFPSGLRLEHSFKEQEKRVIEQWPTYSSYWEQAHAGLPVQMSMAVKSAGRLVFRSSVAYFTPEARKYSRYLLYDDSGFPAGWISDTGNDARNETPEIVKQLPGSGKKKVQLVALSCTTIDEVALQANAQQDLVFTHIKKTGEECRENAKEWVPSHDSLLEYVESIYPGVTYYDSDNCPLVPSPGINVMMIAWRADVAYRVALGKVFLKRWKEAKPEFRTIVLG